MHKNKNLSKFPILVCTTLACFSSFPIYADKAPNFPSSSLEQEEAFLVRRIAEFWKDQDYKLVKEQILLFLAAHPQSKLADQLKGMYGDILLQEGSYTEALSYYEQIKQPPVIEKTIINKLQCYYELNQYEKVISQGDYFFNQKNLLVERKNEVRFIVADSLLRIAMNEPKPALRKKEASEAKVLFEGLKLTAFGDHAELALAEIYLLLEEYENAGNQFRALAATHFDRKEEFLFQSGLAYAKCDPTKAVVIFNEVINLHGKFEKDAQYNQFVILFDQNRFKEVIEADAHIALDISDEKKPNYEYMLGRSYFSIDRFETAEMHLRKYLSISESGTAQHKNAVLMLLSCSDKLGNTAQFEETLTFLSSNYPDSQEIPKALMIKAHILKDRGDIAGAEEQLKNIFQNYPKFEEKETLVLEYGLVTHDAQDWKKSYFTLKHYLSTYPDAKDVSIAWKYLLSSAFHLHQADPSGYAKAEFYEDITLIVQAQTKNKNVFTFEEERDCRLLQCKTAFELDKHSLALKLLTQYIDSYDGDSSLGEVYLLTALCHQKMGSDPSKFYENTEKALTYEPRLIESSNVHLHLYNAYISKATELEAKNNKDSNVYFDKAAEHLYFVFEKNEVSIKLENKLWLAGYYFDQYTAGTNKNESFEKALTLYETTLIDPSSGKILDVNKETAYVEPEVMKYVELLNEKSESQKALLALKDLVSQQHAKADVAWQLKKQALLELGKSYELANKESEALETYTFITNQFPNQSSYVIDYAKLHKARLQLKLTKVQNATDSKEFSEILSTFKDLQIRKQVDSEPLHLEAALDYAKLRGAIAAHNEKETRYLFFLNRIKDDFESSTDPIGAEYQKNLAQTQDKKGLYDLYMLYVDGEILRMKAKMEMQAQHLSTAEELNSQALSKFSEIKNQESVTPYLKQQIEASIKEIDTSNSY